MNLVEIFREIVRKILSFFHRNRIGTWVTDGHFGHQAAKAISNSIHIAWLFVVGIPECH
jgi:hypothetical protein